MSIILDLIGGQFLPYILGGVGALASLLLYGRTQRKKGRDDAIHDIEEMDKREAATVRDRVADARRDGDAIERLRSKGKLRD